MLDSLLRAFGFGLCHQLSERSFFGGGLQVPVCARDTGIYIGFAVSLVVLALLSRGRRPRGFPSPVAWSVLGLLVFTMAVDGVSSYAGWRTTTNDIRLWTGLAAGYACGAVVLPMLNDTLWRRPGDERVLASARDIVIWLATIPVVWLAIRYGAPLLGVGYPLLVVVFIMVTLTAIDLVVVAMLPAFDRQAESWRQIATPAVIAFGFAVLEVWLAALLRAAITNAVGLLS